jgi:autotransporter-associated beta strand protein
MRTASFRYVVRCLRWQLRIVFGEGFEMCSTRIFIRHGLSYGRFALLALLVGFLAALQLRADTITGTGWTGKGANNNWGTAGNWDNTPPSTGGSGDRNLFYGQGYFNAGNNGFTTSNNNLTSWAGYRITFQDITSQPDVSFTITGNSFTLFDFGGNFPKIENLSNVTQTFTLTSGNTITLSGGGTGKTEINPINGDIVFTAGTKVALNSPLDIFGNFNKTVIFNDVLSGAHPVTLQQNSNVVLNAANTYSGNTNIKAGTVYVGANAPSGSAGALGNSTNAVNLGDTSGTANASLYTNGAFTVGRAITVQSGNTGTATIGGNTAAASTYSGNINLGTASGTAKNVTLVAAAGGSVDFSGIINENTSVPNSNVTIGSGTHTGTVRLSGTTNGYSGTTTINGVILEVTELDTGGAGSSIGNSAGAAANLNFSGGTLRYIGGGVNSTNRLFTFDANGAALDASASVSYTGTGSLVASGTGNRTLTLTGPSSGSLASVIPNPSSGTTAVSKTGAGTWTVTGASTYSGGTTVSQGTLLANNTSGSATGTGSVTVASGATLGGTGSVAGAITVNGSLAPGGSIETLDGGALTFGGTGSQLVHELNSNLALAVASDLMNAAGSLLINPGTMLSISDAGNTKLPYGTKFTLISYSGSWTQPPGFPTPNHFLGLPNGSSVTLGQNQWNIRYDDTTGGSNFGGGSFNHFVTITAVPEAGALVTMGLTMLCAAAIAWQYKRKGIAILKI